MGTAADRLRFRSPARPLMGAEDQGSWVLGGVGRRAPGPSRAAPVQERERGASRSAAAGGGGGAARRRPQGGRQRGAARQRNVAAEVRASATAGRGAVEAGLQWPEAERPTWAPRRASVHAKNVKWRFVRL